MMCGAFRRTARKFSFPSSLVLLIIKQVPCQMGYKKCLLIISWYCDRERFEAVVREWRADKITAVEAMKQLDLKPNTFYRRVKEWGL
jgi:RNA processing factor Prp31